MSPEQVNSGTGGSSTTAAGGTTQTVPTASTAGTLPFTGSHAPVVVVIGLGLLGLGVGLRRVSTSQG